MASDSVLITEDDLRQEDVYDERQRLALEELLSKGVLSYKQFLLSEGIPDFLTDDEVTAIEDSALPAHLSEGSSLAEQSLSESQDCSSVLYSPQLFDTEPPVLDLGWPAFTAGSYRGMTRAMTYFQPSDEGHRCQAEVRRLIRSAKEVIAIVTDSLTDLDILRDLQDAFEHRRIAVYILLDKSCALAFSRICTGINISLSDTENLRVRLINGSTFSARSGARVIGKVHERFMLIDGLKVATGSYRYNWSDCRLNTSNLIVLSGQIAESFDKEFRILYANSEPIQAPRSASVQSCSLINLPTSTPHLARDERRTMASSIETSPVVQQLSFESPNPDDDESVILVGESLTECTTNALPVDQLEEMKQKLMTPRTLSCEVSTQTSYMSFMESATQTDPYLTPGPRKILPTRAFPNSNQKMGNEDHLIKVRSRLEQMLKILSKPREFVDIRNLVEQHRAHSRLRESKDLRHETIPKLSEPPGVDSESISGHLGIEAVMSSGLSTLG